MYDLKSKDTAMFTLGHRNIQGMTLLRDGQLLASEQGPRGGDKLIILKQGKNYGWPDASSGTRYGRYFAIGNRGSTDAFEPSLFEFSPSIAPTQVIQLEKFDKDWNDDLLLASLKAQTLYRVRLASPGRVLSVEAMYIGKRIRDVKQIKDKIVLLTDNFTFITLSLGPTARDPKRIIFNHTVHLCATCHAFTATGSTEFAPSLYHVLGRKMGSTDFPNYSPAMRIAGTQGATWNAATIAAFVRDPGAMIHETSMPYMHMSDQDINNVIAALRRQDAASAVPP